MQKTKVGKLSGHDLYFCQLESQEEFAKERPKNGMYFFWIHNGEKIYNPATIISKVHGSIADGTFDMLEFINPTNIKSHYHKLMKAQQNVVVENFKKLRESYSQNPHIPKEMMEYVDSNIKQFQDKIPFPDMDGMFRPDKETVESIHGKGSLEQMYTPEEINEIFKGR
jgi:hypothetical protein